MFQRIYRWITRHPWRSAAIAVVLAFLVVVISSLGGEEQDVPEQDARTIVRIQSVAELVRNGSSISILGTASAVDEAEVRTQIGGQVTAVSVAIGDRVAAGSVLATLENNRERAAVLQAEGAYEAAVASAAQTDISTGASAADLDRSRRAAWNARRSAFAAANTILRTTVEPLFLDNNVQFLTLHDFTWEQRLIRYEIEAWGDDTLAPLPHESGDILAALNAAERTIDRLAAFVDAVSDRIARRHGDSTHVEVRALVTQYRSELSTARSSLDSARQSVIAARAELESTLAAYERAQIAGSGGAVSAADAQVKQALGSLRAAQAALENTIVRSPIDGIISSVPVKRGAYVGAATPVAVVVGDGALEITAHLAPAERDAIEAGSVVGIEGGGTGVVTRIAPAINSATQKYEFKISPENGTVAHGDIVRISLDGARRDAGSSEDGPLFLPLPAVKLTATSAFVFTVENGVLVEHEVVLGAVRGGTIAITSGITSDMEIVVDARGLAAGAPVRIAE